MRKIKKMIKKAKPNFPIKGENVKGILGNGDLLFAITKDNFIVDKSYWLSGKQIFDFIAIENANWNCFENTAIDKKLKGEIKIGKFKDESYLLLQFAKRGNVFVYGRFLPDLNLQCSTIAKDNEIFSFYSSNKIYSFKVFEGKIEKASVGIGYFYKNIGYYTHVNLVRKEVKALAREFLKENRKESLGGYFFALIKTPCKMIAGKKPLPDFEKVEIEKGIEDVDLNVIKVLTNEKTGLSIASIEYENPFNPYQSSGGYGYCWPRDLLWELLVANYIDKKLKEYAIFKRILKKAAKSIEKIYRKFGFIPHRLFVFNLEISPGWANGPLANCYWEYQVDQLASSIILLKIAKSKFAKKLYNELLKWLYPNYLHVICQNCWEDHIGIFSSTSGVILQSFIEFNYIDKAKKLIKNCKVFYKDNCFYMGLEFNPKYYTNAKTLEELKKVKIEKGKLIKKLDSATFFLINAFIEYVRKFGNEKLVKQIISHVEKAIPEKVKNIEGLYRTGKIPGIIRYQGDLWRRNKKKPYEKVWSVSTLLACFTLLNLSKLLIDLGYKDLAKEYYLRAKKLYKPFSLEKRKFLAEQYYSDGTYDSAIPLGWSHSLRFIVRKLLKELNL